MFEKLKLCSCELLFMLLGICWHVFMVGKPEVDKPSLASEPTL